MWRVEVYFEMFFQNHPKGLQILSLVYSTNLSTKEFHLLFECKYYSHF